MLTNQRNSLPEKKSRIISLAFLFLFYTNRGRERGEKGNEKKKKEKRERERRGRGEVKGDDQVWDLQHGLGNTSFGGLRSSEN